MSMPQSADHEPRRSIARGMYWLIFGAILCGWVLLRLMGAERQTQLRAMRQLVEHENQLQHARDAAQDPSDPSEIPTLTAPAPAKRIPVPRPGTV